MEKLKSYIEGKCASDINAYMRYAKLESLITPTQKKSFTSLQRTSYFLPVQNKGQTSIGTKSNNKLSISFSKVYGRILQYSLTPNSEVQS